MRIAEMAPAGVHPYSGVLGVITHLSIELAGRGHEVEVWQVSPWPEEATAPLAALLTAAGIELVTLRPKGRFRAGNDFDAALAARRPDVAHLHNAFSPNNNFLARRLPCPYVITAHGGYAPEQLVFHAWRKSVFKYLFERRLLRDAARVVALTPTEVSELRSFGVETPVVVIPNGVHDPPTADGSAFRRGVGLDREPLALYVGKLDLFHKRVGEVVRAVAATPDWHLALIGPDWRDGREKLARLVDDLGAAGRIHFQSPRRGGPLHDAFAAADVFTLLSRWEGYPIALLEALSHGTPAIVSPEVERRLGVAAAGAGWSAAPGAASEALDAFTALSPAAIEKARVAAAAFARDRDWGSVAVAYEDLFASVLEG